MIPSVRPTAAELAILQVLWASGPCTARHVWESLNAGRKTPVVYTTVLKTMQTMVGKGLLVRDESSRSHVYGPAAKPERVRRSMVGELISGAFGGSVGELVLNALGMGKVSPAELREIRRVIEQIERKS